MLYTWGDPFTGLEVDEPEEEDGIANSGAGTPAPSIAPAVSTASTGNASNDSSTGDEQPISSLMETSSQFLHLCRRGKLHLCMQTREASSYADKEPYA
ncbi:hypothetical protein Drorol1_Dr00008828 [Drosera rotundifolia]